MAEVRWLQGGRRVARLDEHRGRRESQGALPTAAAEDGATAAGRLGVSAEIGGPRADRGSPRPSTDGSSPPVPRSTGPARQRLKATGRRSEPYFETLAM
jgi:hypothetical protein